MGDLAKIADGFDEICADNLRNLRRAGTDVMVKISKDQGDDSFLYYNTAISLGITDALLEFSQTVAGGFIDVLRIGEGYREGTAWAWAKDGLRVLSIAGGAVKVVRNVAPVLVAASETSCAWTSTMKGLRFGLRRVFAPASSLSKNLVTIERGVPGQKYVSYSRELAEDVLRKVANKQPLGPGEKQVLRYLEELASETAKKVDMADSMIAGKQHAGTYIRSVNEMLDAVDSIKGKTQILDKVKTIKDAEKFLEGNNGTIFMRIQWKFLEQNHMIAVVKTVGGTKVVDQTGTFKSAAKRALEIYEPAAKRLASAGKQLTPKIAEALNNPAKAFDNEIGVVFESVFVKDSIMLRLAEVPLSMQAMNPNNMLNQLAVPVFQVPPKVAVKMHVELNKYLGRKPPQSVTGAVQVSVPTGSFTAGGKGYILKTQQGLDSLGVSVDLGNRNNGFSYGYTVKPGETLFGIALKFYGDAAAATFLRLIQPEKLNNVQGHIPLPVGLHLSIPDRAY